MGKKLQLTIENEYADWIREYSFKNNVSYAAVVRKGLRVLMMIERQK